MKLSKYESTHLFATARSGCPQVPTSDKSTKAFKSLAAKKLVQAQQFVDGNALVGEATVGTCYSLTQAGRQFVKSSQKAGKKVCPDRSQKGGAGMSFQMCRVCGCTDGDCVDCVALTGESCHWVEPDLCNACDALKAKAHRTERIERCLTKAVILVDRALQQSCRPETSRDLATLKTNIVKIQDELYPRRKKAVRA